MFFKTVFIDINIFMCYNFFVNRKDLRPDCEHLKSINRSNHKGNPELQGESI